MTIVTIMVTIVAVMMTVVAIKMARVVMMTVVTIKMARVVMSLIVMGILFWIRLKEGIKEMGSCYFYVWIFWWFWAARAQSTTYYNYEPNAQYTTYYKYETEAHFQ